MSELSLGVHSAVFPPTCQPAQRHTDVTKHKTNWMVFRPRRTSGVPAGVLGSSQISQCWQGVILDSLSQQDTSENIRGRIFSDTTSLLGITKYLETERHPFFQTEAPSCVWNKKRRTTLDNPVHLFLRRSSSYMCMEAHCSHPRKTKQASLSRVIKVSFKKNCLSFM